MTRMLAGIALALAVAAAGTILWQRHQLALATAEAARLTRDLADARAIEAQAREAAAVHRAHLKRMEAEAQDWAATIRSLQEMEGRDAPLSDHLGAVSRRLWP